MDIKILVATHKQYQMPKDPIYVPVFCGAAGKDDIGYIRDDQGDNISHKNSSYCELTGLYYGWKNLEYSHLGLVHYRRRFGTSVDSQLGQKQAQEILENYNGIVPKKRRYYIETLYSHYAHTLDAHHLDVTRDIVRDHFPEYLAYVDEAYSQTWGYMFNMFVLTREDAQEYLSWLFDVLGLLEKEIDLEGLTKFQMRIFGRVSEILFNAWVLKKQESGYEFYECPIVHLEGQNMFKKGIAFLQAKFLGKKYEESF